MFICHLNINSTISYNRTTSEHMFTRLLITYPYIPPPHTPTHFLVHTQLQTDIQTQLNPILSIIFFRSTEHDTTTKKPVDITTTKNIDENHGKNENDQNGMSPTTIALIIIAVILSVVIITVAIVVICLKLRQKGPLLGKAHGKTSY